MNTQKTSIAHAFRCGDLLDDKNDDNNVNYDVAQRTINQTKGYESLKAISQTKDASNSQFHYLERQLGLSNDKQTLPTNPKKTSIAHAFRCGDLLDDENADSNVNNHKDYVVKKPNNQTKGYEHTKTTSQTKDTSHSQSHYLGRPLDLSNRESDKTFTMDLTKTRAQVPLEDIEPQRAPFLEQKITGARTARGDGSTALKDKRRQSQEEKNISEFKGSMLSVKSEKEIRGNLSVPRNRRDIPIRYGETNLSGNSLMYDKLLASDITHKDAIEIEAQNKLLRYFLKDLNNILEEQLKKTKFKSSGPKRVEFKDKSSEEKMQTIAKEIINNEKILAIQKEELKRSEARLDIIKDSTYLVNMQHELDTVNSRIEEIKRENRKLGLMNGNLGKDLDVIENVKGVSNIIEQAHEKEKEVGLVQRKLESLKQRNTATFEERKRKLEKEQTLAIEIRKRERSLNPGEVEISEDVIRRYKKLSNAMKAAEDDLKRTEHKCQVKKGLAKKGLFDMVIENQIETEQIQKLEGMIREQKEIMREFMGPEKFSENMSTGEVEEYSKGYTETAHNNKWASSGNIEAELVYVEPKKMTSVMRHKSVERTGKVMNESPLTTPLKSQDQSSLQMLISKHKNRIKRELGNKKSLWKEIGDKDAVRIDLRVEDSPDRRNREEDIQMYSKPLGLKKLLESKQVSTEKGYEQKLNYGYEMKSSHNVDNKVGEDLLGSKRNSVTKEENYSLESIRSLPKITIPKQNDASKGSEHGEKQTNERGKSTLESETSKPREERFKPLKDIKEEKEQNNVNGMEFIEDDTEEKPKEKVFQYSDNRKGQVNSNLDSFKPIRTKVNKDYSPAREKLDEKEFYSQIGLANAYLPQKVRKEDEPKNRQDLYENTQVRAKYDPRLPENKKENKNAKNMDQNFDEFEFDN